MDVLLGEEVFGKGSLWGRCEQDADGNHGTEPLHHLHLSGTSPPNGISTAQYSSAPQGYETSLSASDPRNILYLLFVQWRSLISFVLRNHGISGR